MSNLATVSKGLAESLVKSTETIVGKQGMWGFNNFAYIVYVEKRNMTAIKLYEKLGYRTIWEMTRPRYFFPRRMDD